VSADRRARARASLVGLATGDAFGQRFFEPPEALHERLRTRTLPPGPWPYTDDTVMALSIVEVLDEHHGIDPAHLARKFAARYRAEPGRGYGRGMHEYFGRLVQGASWRAAASSLFDGQGSLGNGGAMRAAPIGAWFHDDLDAATEHARRSAEVTHAHVDGQAGAVAVAVAAACVAHGVREPRELFATVLARMPEGETRAGVLVASQLPLDEAVTHAVAVLGNGSRVLSQDTVPFCLWCVARHRDDYETALWSTVSGLGDRDTTCAIVGGILAADLDIAPPAAWLASREAIR
jgi:ADP-ribosylglycohydrolase